MERLREKIRMLPNKESSFFKALLLISEHIEALELEIKELKKEKPKKRK